MLTYYLYTRCVVLGPVRDALEPYVNAESYCLRQMAWKGFPSCTPRSSFTDCHSPFLYILRTDLIFSLIFSPTQQVQFNMVSHQDFPSRPVPKAKPGQSITLDRLPPEILGKIFYWLFRQEWPRGMDVMFMEDRLFIKDRKAGSLGELDPAHACKALFVAAIQQIFPATTVYMNLNRDFFATNKLLDLPVYENFQGPPYVSRLRNILHLEIIVKVGQSGAMANRSQ